MSKGGITFRFFLKTLLKAGKESSLHLSGINIVDMESWQDVIMVSEMVPCFISVNLNDMLCPLAITSIIIIILLS